jgi:hypothetical protein
MALRELVHEHIVQLLDAGTDAESGRLFLVLEWVQHSLPEWLQENPVSHWNDFFREIGRSVLQALQFAHTRRFTHRDVKPSNVLITDRGVARLADFGVAKLHAFIEPGITLWEFASKPFTPPEPDEGTHMFGRDLYSFAALALSCLNREPLRHDTDLRDVLDRIQVPDDVRNVLRQCLSVDPAERPPHASELLATLDALERKRQAATLARRYLHMTVFAPKAETLEREFGVSGEALGRRLVEELNGPCAIERDVRAETHKPGETHYRMYGSSAVFHAKVESNGDRLLLFSGWQLSPSDCERSRDRACPLPFLIRLRKPADSIEGRDTLRELARLVEGHEVELREREAKRKEERLFDVWSSLLKARSEFESGRTPPIHYSGSSLEGPRARLSVLAPPSDALIGTQWKVRLPNGPAVAGVIDDIYPDAIVFRGFGPLDALPRTGVLRFDAWAAEQAIERQRLALDAVRLDRAVKGNLRSVLLQPSTCRTPDPVADVAFITPDLDEAKQRAVVLGLGTEDLLLVEGPPGTGKTTFIAELIIQHLRLHPEDRVLLASQTHVALDNAIERLKALSPDLRLVRVAGRYTAERVSESVREFLVDSQLEQWRRRALESGQEFIAEWAAARGVSRRDIDIGLLLIELATVLRARHEASEQRQKLQGQLSEPTAVDSDTDEMKKGELEEDIRRLAREENECDRQVKELEKKLKKHDRDLASEFVRLSHEDLTREIESYLPREGGGAIARQLVELHADWTVRFGRTPEFGGALLVASQVVTGTCVGMLGAKGADTVEYDLCIVDEASKATPTELLVPLARARRCVIVGDARQLSPFQEPELKAVALSGKYRLTEDDLKLTLFDHLSDEVPDACRIRLTIQHRMVKPVGDLISHCFYDDTLHSPRAASRHELDPAIPRRVLWLSTSRLPNRRENARLSISNPLEVQQVVSFLKRTAFLAEKGRTHSVAVLTGYSSQRLDLERAVQAQAASWSSVFKVDVNTVDAFQGREADVALYSVTRSNEAGVIGFLREMERINVALSRGREFLVILGDHDFCRRSKGDNPLKRVLDYIETHPDSCALSELKQ